MPGVKGWFNVRILLQVVLPCKVLVLILTEQDRADLKSHLGETGSKPQPTTDPFKAFYLKTGDVNSVLLQPSETRLECVQDQRG